MTDVGWPKALRALLIAGSLLALTVFAAANFVLVDVRLLGLTVRVRLAWVAVVPSLCAFAAGWAYARLRLREAAADADGERRDPPGRVA